MDACEIIVVQAHITIYNLKPLAGLSW